MLLLPHRASHVTNIHFFTINFVIHVKMRFVTVPKFLEKVIILLALSDKRSTEVLARVL